MAATNVRTTASHVLDREHQTAGGFGVDAARQPLVAKLRRIVMANLLWEDLAYVDGASIVEEIQSLVPQVDAAAVAAIAVEARTVQKLRHVPLLIVREMVRHATHRSLVADTLSKIICRPDELGEFVSLYWKTNGGKKSLPAQVKKGLAKAFTKFDEYQLAKWNRSDREVKLRDVLFLVRPKPKFEQQATWWQRLADKQLPTPDTWEVGLSAAKSVEEKRAVWERLIADRKLGALALLKNLRNLQEHGVDKRIIAEAIAGANPAMLLPLDFIRARQFAGDYVRELEDLMFRCCAQFKKLPGWTILVVDVSGSMQHKLSAKSLFNRLDAGAAMAVLAAEMCQHVRVYVTAGSDTLRTHQTAKLPALRGFGLSDRVMASLHQMGGGGIFTRQCLEVIERYEKDADRLIVFSDSQDCDVPGSPRAKPFATHNYIVDVSAEKHGVAYADTWTAEISGWSEHFLRFISELENPTAPLNDEVPTNAPLN